MRQMEQPQQSVQPQEEGSIVGKPVIPQERNNKGFVTRATIDASGCTVQQGATITVADEDGTQGLIEDGNGSEITANAEQIVITGPGGKGPIEFADISGGSDDQIHGPVTVTDSTGISCPGEDNGPIALPGCKNPLQLLKIADNKSTRTEPFFVSAPSFSVLVKTGPEKDGSGSTTVSVFKQRYSDDSVGEKVAAKTFEGGEDGTLKVSSGPGAYFLEIKTQNQSYRIAAEQCGGSALDVGNSCSSLKPPLKVSRTVPAFGKIRNPNDQAYPLRIVYATSSKSGSLSIVLEDRSGRKVLDTKIGGQQRGVLGIKQPPHVSYTFELLPQDQGYTVVFEGGPGTGQDPCTDPGSLDVPAAPAKTPSKPPGNPNQGNQGGSSHRKPLPDTGGATGSAESSAVFVPLAGLALAGATLAGVGLLTRRSGARQR